MEIMNVIEKRDFIHSYLRFASEGTIDEFYEILRKEAILITKLEKRAKKSEADILAGKIFSRKEIEQKTFHISKQ
jgi:hypothetical protein